MQDKTSGELMFPLGTRNPGQSHERHACFMLEESESLSMDCIAALISVGHSRIPVYSGRRDNIKGVLLVKNCIVVDTADRRRVSTLPLVPPFFVAEGLNAQACMNLFQTNQVPLKPHHHRTVHPNPNRTAAPLRDRLQRPGQGE